MKRLNFVNSDILDSVRSLKVHPGVQLVALLYFSLWLLYGAGHAMVFIVLTAYIDGVDDTTCKGEREGTGENNSLTALLLKIKKRKSVVLPCIVLCLLVTVDISV